MTRALKPAKPLVTGWIPCTTPPVRDGVYEYNFTVAPNEVSKRATYKGGNWIDLDGCPLPGLHSSSSIAKMFSWRGVRRWVLVRKADPLLTALNAGVPADAYMADARPRRAKFNGLAGARPFRTQVAAERFAARYSRLGLVAVLP